MGKDTKISWTNSTWNPWVGCRKVSPGCARCYAETLVENRMKRKFTDVRMAKPATFNAPLEWNRELERMNPRPLTTYVFTCSLSDFFIEEADAWRDEAWEIIRRTPHLTYQILTKRPERIAEHLPKTCFRCGLGKERHDPHGRFEVLHSFEGWPLIPWPNVWLGTSVENQKYAEERIPILTGVPAAVHFLSCEPLLGPIDFRQYGWPHYRGLLKDVEWCICGGESGPKFRPMDLAWARSIRDQCKAAGVAFFGKQDSGAHSEIRLPPDLDIREMP